MSQRRRRGRAPADVPATRQRRGRSPRPRSRRSSAPSGPRRRRGATRRVASLHPSQRMAAPGSSSSTPAGVGWRVVSASALTGTLRARGDLRRIIASVSSSSPWRGPLVSAPSSAVAHHRVGFPGAVRHRRQLCRVGRVYRRRHRRVVRIVAGVATIIVIMCVASYRGHVPVVSLLARASRGNTWRSLRRDIVIYIPAAGAFPASMTAETGGVAGNVPVAGVSRRRRRFVI